MAVYCGSDCSAGDLVSLPFCFTMTRTYTNCCIAHKDFVAWRRRLEKCSICINELAKLALHISLYGFLACLIHLTTELSISWRLIFSSLIICYLATLHWLSVVLSSRDLLFLLYIYNCSTAYISEPAHLRHGRAQIRQPSWRYQHSRALYYCCCPHQLHHLY